MVRVAPIPSQASLDWSSLSLSELIADWSPEMNLSADWSEVFFTQFPLYYQRNHHHHKESGGAKESGKNFGRKRMKTRNRIIKWMTKMMAIESNKLLITYTKCIKKCKSMTHRLFSVSKSRLQSCWWQCRVMLATLWWWRFKVMELLCLRRFELCWWRLNVLNRSPTFQSCHQDISSPVSVTNIWWWHFWDVDGRITMLTTLLVILEAFEI